MTEATEIETLAATVRAGLGEDWLRATGATEHFVDGGSLGFDTADLPEPIRLHVLRWTSHRVFKEVGAKRQLLDLLLAEKHRLWVSCAAKDHSDNPLYREMPCTCGRDTRVAAYLALLAQPYTEAAS